MSSSGNYKPVTVNSGGGLTMKKKANARYSNTSSGKLFSINGSSNNNRNNVIGNPNNSILYTGCKVYDTNVKSSVKNYKAYINSKIRCSSNGSSCNISVNTDPSLNKIFNSSNREQSSYLYILKSIVSEKYKECNIDNSGNTNSTCNNNSTNGNRINTLKNNCNITKDVNTVTPPSYNTYLENLFQKKTCLYNPKDAKVIAC